LCKIYIVVQFSVTQKSTKFCLEKLRETRDGEVCFEISGIPSVVIPLTVVSRVFQFAASYVSPRASTRHSHRENDGRVSLRPSLLRVMGVTYRGVKSQRQFLVAIVGYNIIHDFHEIKCKFSSYRYLLFYQPAILFLLCTAILLYRILCRTHIPYFSNMHCKNALDGQSKVTMKSSIFSALCTLTSYFNLS